MEKEAILAVKDLSVSFRMYDTGLEQYDLKVISNLSLDVHPGEIVAIAGSSGSGKSLLAHAVMGLLPQNAAISGEISYKGKVLGQKEKRRIKRKRNCTGSPVCFLPGSSHDSRGTGKRLQTGQRDYKTAKGNFPAFSFE